VAKGRAKEMSIMPGVTVTLKVRIKYKAIVFFIARVMNCCKVWDIARVKKFMLKFLEYKVGNYEWQKYPMA
jgi:hypothetical protein